MNWSLFFRAFIDALLRIKFTLIGLLVLTIVLLGAYLTLEKPNYKTTWVMLLPGTERASTINLDNIGEARSSGSNAYGSVSISPKNTYKEIALSDAVINSAAEKYGVAANAFSKPRITLIDQTPAMAFTLKGESKEELAYRSKLYSDTFNETLDKLRNNEIDRNFQGIESNLDDAKQRLSEARQAIVAYQTESSIVSDDQFKRWMEDTEQLRSEQTNTEVDLAALNATIQTSLTQLGITSAQAKSLLTLQANPAMRATLTLLSEKLATQAGMNSIYAAENPVRKKLDREIVSLSSQIKRLLSGVPDLNQINDEHLYGLLSEGSTIALRNANTLLAKQNGLSAQHQSLVDSFARYLARVKSHTQGAATLADLQRSHQIAEAIFSSALAKLDTSRLDIYATYPLTQLLTRPGATIKRDRLQTKLMIVAGFLIYGMLALALTLVQVRKTILSKIQKANRTSSNATTNSLWFKPIDEQ